MELIEVGERVRVFGEGEVADLINNCDYGDKLAMKLRILRLNNDIPFNTEYEVKSKTKSGQFVFVDDNGFTVTKIFKRAKSLPEEILELV